MSYLQQQRWKNMSSWWWMRDITNWKWKWKEQSESESKKLKAWDTFGCNLLKVNVKMNKVKVKIEKWKWWDTWGFNLLKVKVKMNKVKVKMNKVRVKTRKVKVVEHMWLQPTDLLFLESHLKVVKTNTNLDLLHNFGDSNKKGNRLNSEYCKSLSALEKLDCAQQERKRRKLSR